MGIGKRKGKVVKGAGNPGSSGSDAIGGSLSKDDHWYIQQGFGFSGDPGAGVPPLYGPPSGHTATGGVISDYTEPGGNVYRAHVFQSSGLFEVTALSGTFPANVEYLVVGGGGAGGTGNQASGVGGGGGGAGGLRTNFPGIPVTSPIAFPIAAGPNTYVAVIGGGGANQNSESQLGGTSGVPSYLAPPTVSYPATNYIMGAGGGGGGSRIMTSVPAQASGEAGEAGGGSGGGGSYDASENQPGGAVGPADPNHPQPAGNPGGTAPVPSSKYSAGGGGAGGAGGTGSSPLQGGAGRQVLIAGNTGDSGVGGQGPGPSYGWFAGGGGSGGPTSLFGGGGGGSPLTGFPGGTPYAGGGQGANGISAPSGPWPGVDGQPGLQNTGGGGGGGGKVEGGPNTKSGMGGSGVVIVRYQIGNLQAQAKATGGLISYYNSKTIHIFTTSGDFNNTSGSPITGAEVVMIGGGGGGGVWMAGGGGAGRLYRNDSQTLATGPLAVVIGGGGASGGPSPGTGSDDIHEGRNGGNTIFNSITMPGGGYGAGYHNPGGSGENDGGAGGSGGGGGASGSNGGAAGAAPAGAVTAVVNTNTPPVGAGNAGGTGNPSPQYGAGGGGGVGGAGSNYTGPTSDAGPGGAGVQVPTTFQNPIAAPAPVGTFPAKEPDGGGYYIGLRGGGVGTPGPTGSQWWIGGGGGGSVANGSYKAGGGGGASGIPAPATLVEPVNQWRLAGAGYGGKNSNWDATSGVDGTGAGGGGAGNAGDTGGKGGSGIVLIAYPS